MLNIEDLIEQPEDVIGGSELTPLVIVFLERFFDFPAEEKRRLEALAISPREEDDERFETIITETFFQDEQTPVSRALAPIAIWILRRLSELSESQRRWLRDTLRRSAASQVVAGDDELEDDESSGQGISARLNDRMDHYLNYANWISEGLKPVPPDTIQVRGILEEAVHILFFEQPKKRARLEHSYGRKTLREYRLAFRERVKVACGMRWFWIRRLASKMKIPAKRLAQWLDPEFALGLKGRKLIAATLGVPLETIDGIPDDSLRSWHEYYAEYCEDVAKNCADLQRELEWQVVRWEFFRNGVLDALREDPSRGKVLEQQLGYHPAALPDLAPQRVSFAAVAHAAALLHCPYERLWRFSEV